MKITTKTGDKGETSLFGGRRVSKASGFIELVGELDELQAVIGWCKVEAEMGMRNSGRVNSENLQNGGLSSRKVSPVKLFDKIQNDIYRMMSIVGFEMKCPKNIQPIGEEDVKFLEGEIKKRHGVVENLNKFIRPGATEIAARLHIARTVCRRVERRVAGMMDGGEGTSLNNEAREFSMEILKYLNRLSGLLFVMALVDAVNICYY